MKSTSIDGLDLPYIRPCFSYCGEYWQLFNPATEFISKSYGSDKLAVSLENTFNSFYLSLSYL